MDTTDRTHRLALPYLVNDQAQKHVTVNEGLRALDALVHTSVLSATRDAQPASPAPGDAYLMTGARTGQAWSGFAEHDLAAFQDGAWARFAPAVGMTVWVRDEVRHRVWDGSAWVQTASGGVGGEGGGPSAPQTRADRFGVNAEANATNRLTVKSDAVLHSHDDASGQGTGDARHVINKAGAADTASLVFQTGYSGRAEMGLAGADDFSFKVSADGQAFREAIVIDRASGAVRFPNTDLPSGGGGSSGGSTGGGGAIDPAFVSVVRRSGPSFGRGFARMRDFTVEADAGGHWDEADQWYVVPADGVYACTAAVRVQDGTPEDTQFGFGVHVFEGDNPGFYWSLTGRNASGVSRQTVPYTRIAPFTVGQKLRAVTFVDAPTRSSFNSVAMQIYRLL